MKIQVYRPQMVSPVQQRHSTFGYDQEAQVGQAMQQTGQAVSQIGQQASQFAGLLIQQQNTTEVARTRAEYRRWKTDILQDFQQNPVNPDGTMRYLNFATEYEEAAKRFADEKNSEFSFRGGRRAFSDWMQGQLAEDRDTVTRMAWQSQVESGLQESGKNLNEAETAGDITEIARILSEDVVTGLRSDAQALQISEEMSRRIAVRDIVSNSHRIAMESGSQREGIANMDRALSETFTDVLTGETREFTLGDRESVHQDFRQKWDSEIKMQREERLGEFYPLFENLYQRFHAGNLTVENLLRDSRTAQTQHDPFNMRDYFLGRLRGDSNPDEDFTGDWEDWARRLHADPTITDERFRDEMREKMGQMPGSVFDKFINRPRHMVPEMSAALDALEQAYQTMLRNAGDDEQKIAAAFMSYNQARQMFDSEYDVAVSANLQPSDWATHFSHLGGNLSAKMLNGSLLRSLGNLSVDPERVAVGRQTWSVLGFEIGAATPVFQLQRAIEQGQVIGYREVLQPNLNRLAHGYSLQMNQLVGPGAHWKVTPAGQPYGEFQAPPGSESMLREFVTANGNVNLTFMTSERGANMEMRVWNARTGSWQKINDQIEGALRESGLWTVAKPVAPPPNPVAPPPNAPGHRGSGQTPQPAPRAENSPMSRDEAMRIQREMFGASQ